MPLKQRNKIEPNIFCFNKFFPFFFCFPTGNTQQNQTPTNNKKGCKSGGRTAPPPPVAAPHIDKATPYEFLKAWNSLKTVRNTKPYADLLAQVPPEDLPKSKYP